jgi:hypothetical protein
LTVPVPQDPAKQERLRQARRSWYHATTVAAYDAVGRKSPKWDEPARRALNAIARYWAEPYSLIRQDELRSVAEGCEQALQAGCDDPLVGYLAEYQPFRYRVDWESQERAQRLLDRAESLVASPYPAVRRADAIAEAVSTAAQNLPESRARNERLDRLQAAALPLIPEILKAGNQQAQADIHRICEALLLSHRMRTDGDAAAFHESVLKSFDGNPAAEALKLTLKGNSLTHSAWDARGSGVASTVTAEGRLLFQKRLRQAEVALEGAWRLDPENPLIATEMLLVARGLGYERDRMEAWFRRAMEADGDCRSACLRKLEYLLPRWHGSAEEARAFGLACLATDNWSAGLPEVLMSAHDTIPASAAVRRLYYRQAHVEDDVEAVFEPLLEKHPEALCARMNYARRLWECGRSAETKRQLDRLGGDVWKPTYRNADQVTEFKKAVELAAKSDGDR